MSNKSQKPEDLLDLNIPTLNDVNKVLKEVLEKTNNEDFKLRLKKKFEKIKNYHPTIVVFGDSGVGKSSLINSLFGVNVCQTSDVKEGTKEPQKVESDEITIIDFPGIGHEGESQEKYIRMYLEWLKKENIDLILWVIKADDRSYINSQTFYNQLVSEFGEIPVLFVISQIDKLHPVHGFSRINDPDKLELIDEAESQEEKQRIFEEYSFKLSDKQNENLKIKIDDIAEKFKVDKNRIIPVSANYNINIEYLAEKIIDVLPKEKKYSFFKNFNEEVITENIKKETEKSFIDNIIETAKEFGKAVLEGVKNIIIEKAKDKLKDIFDELWPPKWLK